MTANTPRDDSPSHDDAQHTNNDTSDPALVTDGGVIEGSFQDDVEFGGENEEAEETGEEPSTSADFTEQFDAGDDEAKEISANIAIVEQAEEIIEREGPKQHEDLSSRLAYDYDETKEHVYDVLEGEFASNDDGEFTHRKSGLEKVTEGQEDVGVIPWGEIREVINNCPPRSARQLIADRVEHDHEFIFVRNEEREMEDFRAYDPEEGVYTWDGAFFVEQVVDEGTDGLASSADIDEVVAKLKRRNAVPLEAVNNPEEGVKIAVENGVFDVDSRTLEEHSPEYLFTRKLNARWDPDVDTDAVRDFTRDITDSEVDARVLEEMFGDTLSPHYKREWFGIIYGDGANGKSVAMNCLRKVLGEVNVASESLQDIAETRWSTAQLTGGYGALANIDPDISAKKITEDKLIKNLSGGDAVSGEYKGLDKFSSENIAKMLFGANSPPIFAGDGENLQRRLKPLHLPYTYRPEDEISGEDESNPYIKVRDNDLEARLTTEENRAAWLSVMVDAWHRLEDDGWSYEQTNTELWNEYQAEADTIWSFLNNCIAESHGLRWDSGGEVHLTVEELHQMCAAYHRDRGEQLEMDQQTFARQINKMGVYEMITSEHNKTGGKRSRKWLHPTGKGWQYATRDVIKRFETDCDEIDVPAPEDIDDTSGSAELSSEGQNDGVSVSNDVLRAISQLEMADSHTPTLASIVASSSVGEYEVADIESALKDLLFDGQVQKDGNEFHTAAATDGGGER
ncbi:DNA primase family protein [Halobaculum limi]|uniref:DNA primase family protein n=1 Tax=Halobaculum limi TaxID=3031916 RepID=UPI002407511C|nr:phage/plasmid primase, P4 family [Halobaculum sp. YSMS11]